MGRLQRSPPASRRAYAAKKELGALARLAACAVSRSAIASSAFAVSCAARASASASRRFRISFSAFQGFNVGFEEVQKRRIIRVDGRGAGRKCGHVA